jgi:hypothetical protein
VRSTVQRLAQRSTPCGYVRHRSRAYPQCSDVVSVPTCLAPHNHSA